jgi:hypothetical protein
MRLLRAIKSLLRAIVDHELFIRGYWTEEEALKNLHEGYERGYADALKHVNSHLKPEGIRFIDTQVERPPSATIQ